MGPPVIAGVTPAAGVAPRFATHGIQCLGGPADDVKRVGASHRGRASIADHVSDPFGSVSGDVGDPGASTLSISLSPGSSGNTNSRAMFRGAHPLYYNLYTNAARTIVWGDDSGAGESVAAGFPATSRSAKTFSIYGRVPALQNAWAGVYHDSITVTVSY